MKLFISGISIFIFATVLWHTPLKAESNTISKERAQAIYDLCANCHGDNGQGKVELEAPAIAGLPAWYVSSQLYKFKNGTRGKHHLDNAGLRMRPMARTLTSDKEIDGVASFVEAMSIVPQENTITGDVAQGESKFLVCTSCHGTRGEGNPALKAPPINSSNDWYILTQLQNFKSGIRGVSTDPEGMTMITMSSNLSDQDMRNIVAYIATLQ